MHTQWANTLGRSDVGMKGSVVNVVINLGLSFALIGTYGALGSVVATLIASVVSGILVLILAQRVLPTRLAPPMAKVPWHIAALCSLLTLACTWAADHFIVERLVPEGPLALVTIGLAAAPALALYMVLALGPERTRELLVRIKNRG